MRATRIADGPVPHAKFLDYLSKIDMHLYVTLCETSPMIPLESAIYGRPCLVGPTTTCFNDHQFLREHLVVESPDDISSISRKIQGVIEAYDEISPQLCKWVGDKKKEGQKFRARLNSKEN
ncbi:MAG: hypothetical protein IH859_08030 [Chloroflexi bacterium]|nr:hypothetical protein [Chloroflexota bacterium]